MPSLTRLALVAVLAVAPSARAAVVAVYNSTERPVSFNISHPDKKPYPLTMAAGEARLLTVGRQPQIAYNGPGKSFSYRLEPYHAYMFTPDKAGFEFHGIAPARSMPWNSNPALSGVNM